MKYLLDTNIIVAATIAVGESVRARLAELSEGDAVTSAIAFAEVLYGSQRGKPPSIDALTTFVEEVTVLPFDEAAAQIYARLPFKRAGYDRLIAAQALALGLTLVTDNSQDFSDIPDLKIENWLDRRSMM